MQAVYGKLISNAVTVAGQPSTSRRTGHRPSRLRIRATAVALAWSALDLVEK